jgi:acetyltransferase-like isoleucine patch superfamily enzyme
MTQVNYPQTAIDSGSAKELRAHNRDPRVSIGRGTYGDPRCLILYSADDRIEIGRYCSIAGETSIMGGGEHNHRTTTTFPFYWFHGEDPEAELVDHTKIRYRGAIHKGPTRIGSDVWIGYRATIISGVSIGHGAVVGASAVIALDVPPFAIMVGNPARCLKKRFDDAVIERILAVHWWDWKPEYIYQYQDFLLGEPKQFLEVIDALDPAVLAAMYESDPRAIDVAYEPLDVLAPPPPPPPVTPTPPPPRSSPVKRFARQVMPPIIYTALSRLAR